MLLELKLCQIEFEGSVRAEALIMDVFGGNLEKEVIRTGVGPVRYFKDSEMGFEPELSGRVNMRHELLPDMCVNPVIMLDIS